MKQIIGTSNRVLEVDLNEKSYDVYSVEPQERQLYLGAKGLGLKLLYDRMKPGVDPLGPENIIAFMPGILMGTGGLCSGRFDTITKSPLTGIMVSSSCGGPFGLALKTAGWDGLIIKGKTNSPVYLDIDETGIQFIDAVDLWGLEIPDAQSILDQKKAKSLVIGPAGENSVLYANVAAGHRFLGRGGIGAVMGSKNLKAIRATGGAYKIKPCNPKGFKKVNALAKTYINRNAVTSDRYRNYGTASNVRPCHEHGILPMYNFKDGKHEQGDQVSGEIMAQDHDTKHHTCKPCTIRCGHNGQFKNKTLSAPEYETIGLLGTSLGIFDLEKIARFNHICTRLGLDTISAGGTLSWVMEAAQKGLIDYDLKFGSAKGVEQALFNIAYKKAFGEKMAQGSRALSDEYGGKDFAIQVKGLEMSAYDPRGSFGQGLSYAVANRGGCHLSAYLIAQEVVLGLLKPDTTFGKEKWVKFLEDLTCCINSLQTCYFTSYALTLENPMARMTPKPVLKFLMQYLPDAAIMLTDVSVYTKLWNTVTGIKLSNREFLKAGERIHMLERYMNTREGISKKDDTLPDRMLKQGREFDKDKKTVPLASMLPKYYRVRGYDKNGIPLRKKLETLGILKPSEKMFTP